jgi:hypothetical protein
MTERKATSPEPGTSGNVKPAEEVTMEKLLCDIPLHSRQVMSSLFSQPEFGTIEFPSAIRVHCDHEQCGGVRLHDIHRTSSRFEIGNNFYYLISYLCTNCRISGKIFGVKAEGDRTRRLGLCTKIYQAPPFGEPIPKRLFEVIGEDNREPFLQARRAIARGLGIGAYAYYRRIVENTKFALVDTVPEVVQATQAPTEQIDLLKRAQSERQFSKAIEMLRDGGAIPPVLLIDGHNPLTLLHDLLSDGIHELDDEECLERAQEAEVILCEIANKMQIALTERKAVKAALSSILNRKAKKDELVKTSRVKPPQA